MNSCHSAKLIYLWSVGIIITIWLYTMIGCGVHIYVCGRKKYLNRTLEIDSPFQTFAVGNLVEFID